MYVSLVLMLLHLGSFEVSVCNLLIISALCHPVKCSDYLLPDVQCGVLSLLSERTPHCTSKEMILGSFEAQKHATEANLIVVVEGRWRFGCQALAVEEREIGAVLVLQQILPI